MNQQPANKTCGRVVKINKNVKFEVTEENFEKTAGRRVGVYCKITCLRSACHNQHKYPIPFQLRKSHPTFVQA